MIRAWPGGAAGLLLLTAAPHCHAMAEEMATQPSTAVGTYRNPILIGDYSDPDVIRVGDRYYMTASSFANVPGLPILESLDLVHWRLIGHALPKLSPRDHFATPRRGGGVWAPTLRYRAGLFHIYFPDPDHGIFLVTSRDPAGPWSTPVLVDATPGAIDPAPYWDGDGRAWLAFALAQSRAGRSNVILIKPMDRAGRRTTGPARTLIDANRLPPAQTSIGPMPWLYTEGPKLYRRDGWIYLFVPSGSVRNGWQAVFRSRSLDGPWEHRVVLDQGATDINGPHQGALVEGRDGRSWFVHFQDRDSYGRVVHLQPVRWADGWPVIGKPVADGRGAPVAFGPLPEPGVSGPVSLQSGDRFSDRLSLAWQWQANPGDDWARVAAGRLHLRPVPGSDNLWEVGNLLSQKLPAREFVVTTRLALRAKSDGERAGLAMFGADYGWIGVAYRGGAMRIVQTTRSGADRGERATVTEGPAVKDPVTLRLIAQETRVERTPVTTPAWPGERRELHLTVRFQYSHDGRSFTDLGAPFVTRPGRWVGAQFGIFAQAPHGTPSATAVASRIGDAEFGPVEVTTP